MTTEEIRKAWIAEHLKAVHEIDKESKELKRLEAERSIVKVVRAFFAKKAI